MKIFNNSKDSDCEPLLIQGNNIALLTKEYIYRYIEKECQEISLEPLNIDNLANAVHSKLNTFNTLDELNDFIIHCSTELSTSHDDYKHISIYFNMSNVKRNFHDIDSKNDHDTIHPDVLKNVKDPNGEPFLIQENGTLLLTKDYIYQYVQKICQERSLEHLNIDKLVNAVHPKLKNSNTLDELNDLIITCSTELVTNHYDYQYIAVYLLISKLHQETHDDYLETVKELRNNININGDKSPILSENFEKYVVKHIQTINEAFHYERDYQFTIFGYRTLEKSYLKKLSNGKMIERPQHLFMRVAIAIHYRTDRMDLILKTYHLLSEGYFTLASPTLFNAGTNAEQMSSCFLLGLEDDMGKIGECLSDCMKISKYAGGLGVNVTHIRTQGAYINSTQGKANGLRASFLFNSVARYADQCGKRAGSIALYLEPWHGDIFFFLDLKKNVGAETERARDIFLALFINDIFMERVENNEMWSLMCPSSCPKLLNKYGDDFKRAYQKYEKKKKYLKRIPARDLWFKIMESQIETGIPYILFKDAINYKSNQKNLGTINNSNLCAEICIYSDSNEYGVCNLSSICLPRFVKEKNGQKYFDYDFLFEIARVATRNLDNIIDYTFYPTEKARISNMKHRPIGIGVQGLANVFMIFRVPFDSEFARDLNRKIFETIYFGAMTESMILAKEKGPYSSYEGSPISQGLFQFDLWEEKKLSGMWDWEGLRKEIKKYGVRNSLTTACMPTATTSQIFGNNEAFEPFTSNIYTRNTLAGEFYVVSKYLMQILSEHGLWNDEMVDLIRYYDGSIENFIFIPEEIREIYKTSWTISQKAIIDMAADRGPFVDQTQSMNIFIDKPNFGKLNSCLFYAWKKKLKTGMYYLRSKAGADPLKFGIDPEKIEKLKVKYQIVEKPEHTFKENIKKEIKVCPLRPKNNSSNTVCEMCSS
jgi:ribonucleoside-diphosphate reductase alpha subunit